MNEFLSQFLVESRELIDQASEGLLVLEKSPADAELIDGVFRAFHTLKGGAGIVEFAAMERVVHAAEEVLSDVRSSTRVLTPDLVGDCLACLDQVVQWLDALEASGELPMQTEAATERIVGRLAREAVIVPEVRTADWLPDWLVRNETVRRGARVALRHVPDPQSFFGGEDPLARLTSLPGLLALDVQPNVPWPDLDVLDVYRCNLVLSALTSATLEEVAAHMNGHSGTCETRPLDAGERSDASSSLPEPAQQILHAQLALIAVAASESFAGTISSAGRVASNVLRSCGRIGHAELMSSAAQKSLQVRTPAALTEALHEALGIDRTTPPERTRSPAATALGTIRVEATRIDALVRLTGELTIAKNSLAHVLRLAMTQENPLATAIGDSHAALARLVNELQRSVLGIRVMPLQMVLQRFPRVVRDLAASLGKPVELVIQGEDTEADRDVVEMLFEPLLHVVRNAMDHGIESRDVRLGRDKAAVAQIGIRAHREADRVFVEVSDDGAGVDVERVREIAAERRLVEPTALQLLNDAEIAELIFAPGFSTAARVSELSGRGVGMDAVRSAVERIGGRVSIETRRGHGTTVRFDLPFSVMMTQVMTLEVDGQMFGVPLESVRETVRVPRETLVGIGAASAIVLRDRTVPVIDLGEVLGRRRGTIEHSEATLVVVDLAGELSALRVDQVGERLQVMLKPLEGLLTATRGVSGTTVLGDGRVLLVLDVAELLS